MTRLLAVFIAIGCCGYSSPAFPASDVERLTWAGVKIATENTTVFIDPVGTDIWGGEAPGGLVPVESDTPRTYAVITHAHNDHFDVPTLQRVLGERGYVICHESLATYIASRGLKVIPAKLYEPVERGGFLFTAVPAVDGFGDQQVSWVVNDGQQRFFHGGDTLWHGRYRQIGKQFGPFAAAFLPMNAPIVGGSPLSEIAAVMSPEQAVDAAILLSADTLVPIHYGAGVSPGYAEPLDLIERLIACAERRDVNLAVLEPGDRLH